MVKRKTKRPARQSERKKSPRKTQIQENKSAKLTGSMDGFQIVHDMAKALTSSLQLDHVLNTIMEKVEQLLQPDTWSLLLVDEKTNELYFQIATGEASSKLKDVRLKMGEGVAGWVAKSGEAQIVPDVSKEPRFNDQVDQLTKMSTHSIVCVPIRTQQRVLGVIEIINHIGHRDFDDADLGLLQAMADYAAIALENALHVQRIHELTITDDTTELYNVRHLNFILETEIYRSTRYQYEFSLLFIDLDHFKLVNDTHGHLIGSKLLRELAGFLRNSLRLIDYAFRYGGDEFVILLPQTDKESATVVARRLRERLNSSVFIKENGLNLRVTASIGLATFPGDATTKAELIRLADQAMYQVKNANRDNIAVVNVGILD